MDKLRITKSSFNNKYSGRRLEAFLTLPKKAQELIFATMYNPETAHWYSVAYDYTEEDISQMTPIEIIFDVAYSINKEFYEEISVPDEITTFTPLLRQEPVMIEGKKYIPDFLFLGSECENPYSPDHSNFDLAEQIIEQIKDIKIVIECDGHDFHQKTKQQVARDNERELDLKMHGFDVVRFSGSQIYNDPLGCAEKAHKYIATRISNHIWGN